MPVGVSSPDTWTTDLHIFWIMGLILKSFFSNVEAKCILLWTLLRWLHYLLDICAASRSWLHLAGINRWEKIRADEWKDCKPTTCCFCPGLLSNGRLPSRLKLGGAQSGVRGPVVVLRRTEMGPTWWCFDFTAVSSGTKGSLHVLLPPSIVTSHHLGFKTKIISCFKM